MRKTYELVGVFLTLAAFALGMQAPASSGAGKQSSSTNAKVDLNTASEQELESLPESAQLLLRRLSLGDPILQRARSRRRAFLPLRSRKSAFGYSGQRYPAPTKSAASKSAAPAKPIASSAAGAMVDLNTASAAELKELPGVGDATAKKIISGRPSSSVGDLWKAGVSAATISKITPLVTIGNAPAASAPSRPTSSATNPPPSSTVPPPAPTPPPTAPASAKS